MMFARWSHVRIRAAEKALRHGRIDDALAALRELDLREDSRGQRLLDDLSKPLLARARLRRQAGHYADALADLAQLLQIGRDSPEAQALRQSISDEQRRAAQQAAARHADQQRVAEQLEAGRLETARLNVQNLADTRQREQLAEQVDVRLRRGQQLLAEAGEALRREDLLAAIRLWNDACQRQGRTVETDRMAGLLGAGCRRAVERWCAEGRLEGLLAAADGVRALLPYDPTLAEAQRLIELCGRATSQLATGDYAGLRQSLLRLKAAARSPESGEAAPADEHPQAPLTPSGGVEGRQRPGATAGWIETALEAVGLIAEGQEVLLSSPLGLFASAAPRRAADGRQPEAGGGDRGWAMEPELAAPVDGSDEAVVRLDRPWLVLVDGGASALMWDRPRVRIGRDGSASEVAIPAEIHSHHADVVRLGEDYFLEARHPVELNRRPAQRALLRDGDRLALGGAAKLVFVKPSARSDSAVLRLSHRCRLADDVSEVVLFSRTCLVGPTPACHLRTTDPGGPVVLFERQGRLYARPLDTTGTRLANPPMVPVLAGQTLDCAGLRITFKPYGSEPSGRDERPGGG